MGVTDDTVTLGFWTADAGTFAAGAAAVGYQYDPASISNLDLRAETQALVDYFNANGGLAGRQIRPVYYQVNLQNLLTRSGKAQEAQAACATWTEDNRVFSFETFKGFTEDNIIECAVDNRVVMFDPWYQGAQVTRSRLQEVIPYWYATVKMVAEQREKTQVERLHAAGFFDKGHKLGILTEDIPMSLESAAKGLKPALRAHGIPLVAEAVYPDVIESPWSTYVLQFQQAGITHVMFSTSTYQWLAAVLFMRAAEQQGYRPRYGLTTDVNPGGDFTDNVSPNQLKRAIAVGWYPTADIGAEPEGPEYELCMKVEREAGQAGASAVFTCEYLFFLQAALTRAPEFSVRGLEKGVEALERSFPSIFVPVADFSRGRRAAVAQVRTTAFDESCGCFNKYNSPPYPVAD